VPGLLSTLRVLDLAIWRPGPYATQLLAELGADVVKVEPPGGDPMRGYPELFAALNAGKRGIVLDLKTADGRRDALSLAADADVVVEGFRPGVVTRLGVDYAAVRAVNPSIVYCSLSGLGQEGPLAAVPGHDLNYQAWAGALAPEGGPPVVAPTPIADLAGGLAAAFAICAATVRRQATGEGEYVDVAMTDVLATWTGAATARTEAADVDRGRPVAGYGLFETADGGVVALGVLTEDHFWRALCDVLGLARHRDLDFATRMASSEMLQRDVGAAIAQRRRRELVDALLAAGAPVAPVLDRGGMLANDHLRGRGVVTTAPWGDVWMGHLARLTHHPAGVTDPAPRLDEHRGAQFRPRR
jgi:crotonobetainyl-CoA:carnitine CoA-transferase CaiB-like acyl-CoA transferase